MNTLDRPTSQADGGSRADLKAQSGRTPPGVAGAPARNSHFRLPFRCTKNLDSCSVTRLNPLQLSLRLPTFILPSPSSSSSIQATATGLSTHIGSSGRLQGSSPRLACPSPYAQPSQPLSCHHAGRPHQRHLKDHAPASSLYTSFRIWRRLTASSRNPLTSSTILVRCSRSRLGSFAHPSSAITC